MKLRTITQNILCISIAAIGLFSCTKTEIIPLEETVKNRILEYKIINDSQLLQGAVDNISNTITVYIPYYSGIDVLIPEIKLETGAVLVDDKNQEINLEGGLEAIPVNATDYKYHILGSDDKVRDYKLILKIQAFPAPLEVGFSFDQTGKVIKTGQVRNAGGIINLYGNFESTSRDLMFVATNRATGKQIPDFFKVNSMVSNSSGLYQTALLVNIEADAGSYDIQLTHKGRQTTLPDFEVIYSKPTRYNADGASTLAWTKKPGDIITLNVRTGSTIDATNGIILGLERVYMIINKDVPIGSTIVPAEFEESLFGKPIDFEIVSFTRSQIKLRVPNLPAGMYTGVSSTNTSSINYASFGLYFDYEDSTGWGKNNFSAVAFDMNILK